MNANPIGRTSRFNWLTLIFLAAACTAGGCATDKSVISQATQTNEQLQSAIVTDPQLANYIQQVGNRIVAAGKQADKAGIGPKQHFDKNQDDSWMYSDMKFYLVKSNTVNAFTTGGKYMYIYTALFDMCKSEDELAAVMSHEYAHVYCRHVQHGTNNQYKALAVAGAAGLAGAAVGGKDNALEYGAGSAAVAYAAATPFLTSFTSSDENQADKFGFAIYAQAGWDPNKFGDFFQHLIDAGNDPKAGGDHPPLGERVDNAKRRASELPAKAKSWAKPDVASGTEFAGYVARSKTITASAPKDEATKKAQTLLAAFPSCVTVDNQPQQIKAREEIKSTLDAAAEKQSGGK